MGRAPFVSCNFFERRIAAAHIYQAAVHIMIFNKEERTYWIESYKKFPTSNISDAMDNLGLRSGVILGLHPLDVYQPRTAGFAKTLRQMRRKTAFDGKSLTKQASIIDSQTEYGNLLVIEANVHALPGLQWIFPESYCNSGVIPLKYAYLPFPSILGILIVRSFLAAVISSKSNKLLYANRSSL